MSVSSDLKALYKSVIIIIICNLSLGRRHLVNTYEVEGGTV